MLREPPHLRVIEPHSKLHQAELWLLVVRVVAELADELVGLDNGTRIPLVDRHAPCESYAYLSVILPFEPSRHLSSAQRYPPNLCSYGGFGSG